MVLCVHGKGILLMVIFLFVVGTETVGANLLIFVFSIFSSSLAFRDRKHRRVVLQLIATDVWQRRGVTKKDLRGVGYLRGWEWRALTVRSAKKKKKKNSSNLEPG
jgi:hypothetical protein